MASRTSLRHDLVAMLRLAWPVVLAELGWMLQGVVDTIMVGKMGAVSIGAVALGNALYYGPSLFGLGLLLGLDTVISHAYGRRDYEACHRWLAQGVYIAFIFTPPLMLLVLGILALMPHAGIAPQLLTPVAGYVRVEIWGTLPLLLYAASRRYLQAVGQVRVITITFVVANLFNWGANWVLIYGHFGFPAMGVRGSALSTVIARAVMALMLFGFAWRYERKRGHPLFAHWAAPHLRELRQLLKLGLPSAAQLVSEVGAFAVATVLAGKVSPSALAAHQIALNYAAVAYMVPLGISSAAAIAVGHAVGEGNIARARRSGNLALGIAVVFMAAVAVIFLCVPRLLISLYTQEASVVAVGVPLLGLAAAFAIFDGLQIVSTGALRGFGRTRVPMYANMGGYWLFGLPLGAYLCFATRHGVYGIWIGLTAALIVISLVCSLYWRKATPVSTH